MLVTFTVDDQLFISRHDAWAFLVKLRAGWICEDCGHPPPPTSRGLEAHHLNENSKDHRLANGRALCPACHRARHPMTESRRAKHKRPHAAESRAKIAASVKANHDANPEAKRRYASHTPAARAKMSASAKARGGRAHSEETKAKMSASRLAYLARKK